MGKSSPILRIISNVQIQSALIWAAVILMSSYITKDHIVSMMLISAAGFHVVLLSNYCNKKSRRRDQEKMEGVLNK